MNKINFLLALLHLLCGFIDRAYRRTLHLPALDDLHTSRL